MGGPHLGEKVGDQHRSLSLSTHVSHVSPPRSSPAFTLPPSPASPPGLALKSQEELGARTSSNADTENRLTDLGRGRGGRGGGEAGTNGENSMETHTQPYGKQIASGNLLYDSESLIGCSVTTQRGGMKWEVGGRGSRGRGRICIPMTDSC